MITDLLVAIVQPEDYAGLMQVLNARGYRATRIDSSGGFLRTESVIVLMGLPADQVDDVLWIMADKCHTRMRLPLPPASEEPSEADFDVDEVLVGGAVIIRLPVLRHVALAGLRGGELPDLPSVGSPAPGPDRMVAVPTRLVVAVVQDRDASRVVDALVGRGYGATRINTIGGFLQRGNASILVGVAADQVDEAIATIDANCEPRELTGGPGDRTVPVGAGNVFVLSVERFARA